MKFFVVGKKGYDILRRVYGDKIIERVDLRDVKFDVRCGHKFHPACLQEYIAKYDAGEVVLDSTHPGAVCPVCRERLIVDLAPPWRTWFAPRPEAV